MSFLSEKNIIRHRKRKLSISSDSDEDNPCNAKEPRLEPDNISWSGSPDMFDDYEDLTRRASELTMSIIDEDSEILESLPPAADEDLGPSTSRQSTFDSTVAQHPTRPRSKISQPSNWQKNLRKNAKNHGLEYTSTTGNVIPPKQMLPICSCGEKCYLHIDEEQRQEQFDNYWALGDINRQRDLLGKLILIRIVKRRRVEDGVSRRKNTLTYRFNVNGNYIKVCKLFFINTLGIGERILRVIVSKNTRSATGVLSPDNRGRHEPANKLSTADIAGIRSHIALLPKVPAHWCRKNSSKIYLEGNLNKETVYQLYQSYAAQRGLRLVSKPTYLEQLDLLNIGFHQPRKDQCWCANFCKLSEEEKAETQQEYDLHVRRKNAAREEKNKDTDNALKNPKIITASFDLEAILYSPFVSTKQLFYKRKFATHNFTVFVTKKKKGYCYMWPEHFGKKGSQEIATCLAKFINDEIPNGAEEINFFADNCAGQNKNCVIVAMLGVALQAHPTLRQINLKFLEVGHTYMECDTMHSTIERASRNENIYVPNDWVKIARHAKKTGNQYCVHTISYDQFGDYKELKNKIFGSNLRFRDQSKVKWRSAKWIQLRRESRRSVFIKNEYWESFKELNTQRRFRIQPVNQLYNEPLQIAALKYNDLMSLCTSKVIPKHHHQFYRNLPVAIDEADNGAHQNDLPDGRALIPRKQKYRQ